MSQQQQIMALGWATGQAIRIIWPWLWLLLKHKGGWDPKYLKEAGAAFLAGIVANVQLGPMIPASTPPWLAFTFSAALGYMGQDALGYVRKYLDLLNIQHTVESLPAAPERAADKLTKELEKTVEKADIPPVAKVLVEQKIEEIGRAHV